MLQPANGRYGKAIISDLKNIFDTRVVTSTPVLNSHASLFTYHTSPLPDAVVYPTSEVEIVRLLQYCGQHAVPVVPYGNGTSFEGQVSAPHGGISIDLSMMNAISAIQEADMIAVVQSGVLKSQLDKQLAATSLFFPIGPEIDVTLGGMAATRASGTNAVRYGTIRENILGMRVVLPSGRIIETGCQAKKSAAGYDLTHLMIGSEGTLGIITELTLKLHPKPRKIGIGIVQFSELSGAINAAVNIIKAGIPVAKIELLDEVMIEAINQYSHTTYQRLPTLFIEVHGSEFLLAESADEIDHICAAADSTALTWSGNQLERDKLWKVRADAAPAAKAFRPTHSIMGTDACVPISQLLPCIEAARQDSGELGLVAPIVGHVGDGNFHLAILFDPQNEQEFSAAKELSKRIALKAIASGGTCSGEHGIGTGKLPYMSVQYTESTLELMATIKRIIDPLGIMNPGKLVVV